MIRIAVIKTEIGNSVVVEIEKVSLVSEKFLMSLRINDLRISRPRQRH